MPSRAALLIAAGMVLGASAASGLGGAWEGEGDANNCRSKARTPRGRNRDCNFKAGSNINWVCVRVGARAITSTSTDGFSPSVCVWDWDAVAAIGLAACFTSLGCHCTMRILAAILILAYRRPDHLSIATV